MTPEHRTIAAKSILLSGASPEALEVLLKNSRLRPFDRGACIFLQGEKATAIYIVVEGWVKLYRVAPNGAEAVVGVFTKGRSFGEAVAFRSDVYPVAAEAVTDCKVIRIEAEAYLRQIRENPDFAVSMLSATFVHLQSLVSQVEALKAQTGAQRVAEFLLELSSCESGECEVTLPYDKVLIAGRLGMKPESLSRAFGKLREHGVKIQQNHALISDIAALRDFSLEDPATSWNKL
ncbi:Crp/Fnr family transcriptional regulator [Pseudorhodobacter ferrugineus]|uniref:Crp/Fnr family transcriptional regulator n=1 Tax=Pseudorhodobacter ferrugineus TaxID=77008 RepID=UPI0003B6FDF0|nr:Crp/Fnr family transcriptional regulator [Pseudorhodobacter ferrugineus]